MIILSEYVLVYFCNISYRFWVSYSMGFCVVCPTLPKPNKQMFVNTHFPVPGEQFYDDIRHITQHVRVQTEYWRVYQISD